MMDDGHMSITFAKSVIFGKVQLTPAYSGLDLKTHKIHIYVKFLDRWTTISISESQLLVGHPPPKKKFKIFFFFFFLGSQSRVDNPQDALKKN